MSSEDVSMVDVLRADLRKRHCRMMIRDIPLISGAHAHYAYNSTAHAYTCIACV